MIAWILTAALIVGPARAQGGKSSEFSDAAIARRQTELDQAFSQVQLEADQEFQNSVAFHARLKQERLDFERERLVERKNMLDSLRGLPAGERKAVYERFHAAESHQRADFAKQVAVQKAAFRREFLGERQDAKHALKRRREALAEGHRTR
jgi:translation elongation factor EF-Ts